MPLKQQHKAGARDAERDQDGDRASGDEAKPQRSHGTSGIR
jgi:hypothetical protein